MRSVLGIDDAWTLHKPSAVALVVEQTACWRLLAVETSYLRLVIISFCCLEDPGEASAEAESAWQDHSPAACALVGTTAHP